MRKIGLMLALFGTLALSASAKGWDGTWALTASKLTYHVNHPMHHVEATSTAAKGKAICDKKGAHILVACPVKTFASGDGNRDLHMMEVTRGATYPMVTVRAEWAAPLKAGEAKADVDVDFAGHQAHYAGVTFRVEEFKDGTLHITGTVPANIKDFDIQAPSLLAVPIQSAIPVDVDLTWSRPTN